MSGVVIALTSWVLWFAALASPGPAAEREGAATGTDAARTAVDPGDVESVDSIVTALYDVISGPAGAPREWSRMRGLFIPEARLAAVRHTADGRAELFVMTVDEYIEAMDPYFAENAFYESELARRTEQFGHMAHVFSTYESRKEPAADPFMRGINSIQLFHDGVRWWVVTVFWDSETGHRLPARYLGTR